YAQPRDFVDQRAESREKEKRKDPKTHCCSVGQLPTAPHFNLPDKSSGKTVSPDSVQEQEKLIAIFISSRLPFNIYAPVHSFLSKPSYVHINWLSNKLPKMLIGSGKN